MREADLHTARAAYDAIAPVYADQFKDTLDDRPTERALLAAFAEVIRRGPAGIVADLGCGPPPVPRGVHTGAQGVDRRHRRVASEQEAPVRDGNFLDLKT